MRKLVNRGTEGQLLRLKFHQIGLPPYYERNVQSKSTSSVRRVALSLLPPFAAPPLESIFGFRSRTVRSRFFPLASAHSFRQAWSNLIVFASDLFAQDQSGLKV